MIIAEEQIKYLEKAAYLTERKCRNMSKDIDENLIQKWMLKSELTQEMLRKRLKDSKISEEKFNILLSEKDNPVVDKSQFLWGENFYEIFNLDKDINLINYKPSAGSVFFPFYKPFLIYTEKILVKKFKKMNKTIKIQNKLDQKALIQSILKTLHIKLQSISLKVLISELNIARITNMLEGSTTEERFQYFTKHSLNNREYILDLFNSYPVMARLMVEAVNRFLNVYIEAIDRFLQDRHDISESMNVELSLLTEIEGEVGDSHNGGRTVMIFVFSNGIKLVYKPRKLAIDRHFQEFISWINSKGFSHPLSTMNILDRGLYGWQEFVQHQPCKSKEEINRFYYRQGGYIAILYLFRSVDFHHENIIASGEHPFLIDLETIFSNHTDLLKNDSNDYDKTVEAFHESVLNSIMLPIKSTNSVFDFDLSGLGGAEGQVSKKMNSWALENVGTDKMKIIKEPIITEEAKNRPLYNCKVVPAINYTNQIVSGFKEMYHLFLEFKQELMSHSGPIWIFSNDTVRHVLRSTQTYGSFLDASTHPDYLQNGLDRVQIFDYFWHIIKNNPKYKGIVSMETQDLLEHDIPYFTFNFNSKSIFDSRGNEIEEFYSNCSLELVMRKCQLLSNEDCERQTRYIELSLASMEQKPWFNKEYDKYHWVANNEKVDSNQTFLTAAKEIGDYLYKHTIWSNDREKAYWIGLNADHEDNLTLSSIGMGLYDGVLGIVLFLAYLEQETENIKYGKLARAALRGIKDLIKQESSFISISAFYGYTSAVYVFFHLGVLWEDTELKDLAISILKRVKPMIEEDRTYDFLGGLAGVIVVCLQIYKNNSNLLAFEIAEECGEKLYQYVNIKLINDDGKNQILTGLSHGATGYAWAFSLLASITKKDKYWRVVNKLLDYEQAHYIEHHKNWKDLRNIDTTESLAFWCHGAPGIGLGRLMIMCITNEHEHRIKDEWKKAIDTTLERGFGFSHSLCHGDFGNLDFLQLSARKFGLKSLEKKVNEMGLQIVKRGMKKGWSMGLNSEVELLGMFLGLSGMGYGILRLINPEIPSVTTLQIPTNITNEKRLK